MKSSANYYNQKESERLIFRKLTLDDVDLWSKFFENNDREHFLGPVNSELSNFEKSKNWITRQIERYVISEFGQLAIIEKETSQMIGVGGIIPRELEGKLEYEITYSLLPNKWGKGYATELSSHFIDWAFKNQLTTSLISIIHIDNFPSKNVALKNGLKFDFQSIFMTIPVQIFRINKK